MILINSYCAISLDLDRSNNFIRSRELHLNAPDIFISCTTRCILESVIEFIYVEETILFKSLVYAAMDLQISDPSKREFLHHL